MIAYKLFRVLRDGSITSLFINKTKILDLGIYLSAENHETKGFKNRPFWHCLKKPEAPHLSMKNRRWYIVEIKDFTVLKRPQAQGGEWILAKQIKIIKKY